MAIYDYPKGVQKFNYTVNELNFNILDEIIYGPFKVLIVCDNQDINVQTPNLFTKFPRYYYTEVARRNQKSGKYLAVPVDGG